MQTIGRQLHGRIGDGLSADPHMALLDQSGADAARPESLGEEHFLQLHAASIRRPRRSPPIGGGKVMKIRGGRAGLAAALLAAAPCWSAQWFAVGGPRDPASRTLVEVDLETLGPRRHGGEAVIRVSHASGQAHEDGFRYRSFVGNAHFDCQRRTVTLTSAAYYRLAQGQGERLGSDSAGSASGMPPRLLHTIPAADRQALLRASCATTQSPPPGTP